MPQRTIIRFATPPHAQLERRHQRPSATFTVALLFVQVVDALGRR
jgi:hypothetical protein